MSTLKFVTYDDPEIIHFTHMNNADAWKGLLTSEQYTQREKVLGSTDISQKDRSPDIQELYPIDHKQLGIKYFVLKDESLPETDKFSQIVSSCETLNRLGYCIKPDSNGTIEPALVVCIGGVFTETKFRGKGYAARMIEKLNNYYDDLIKENPDSILIKNLVINLYSEVDDYYQRFGYHSFHVPLHYITQFDQFMLEYCPDKLSKGKFLNYDDYQHLVDSHDINFKKKLIKLHEENPEKFIFTVKPDLDIFKWFQDRDIFIGKILDKIKDQDESTLKFGFELNDGSHIIWHHNWNSNLLVIVKVAMKQSDRETLSQLIGQSILEAKRYNLDKIQFWDEEIPLNKYPQLMKTLESLEKKDKLYVTNGSVSAVRPPTGFNKDTIIWDNNTKFCWF